MKPTPKYPIYVISKGRHDCCHTAKFLTDDKVPFRLVVEPQEADAYASVFGRERLLITPFSNLGQGSIPSRNFVWQHSIEQGAEKHWILDDNILGTWRRYKSRKLRCDSAFAFAASETFADRYSNLAILGLNYYMFAINKASMPPFYLNVHVYSFMLIENAIPYRWRGRYNEDTDLCLQVLSGGLCTVLLNAFLAWKMTTMTMKGGNSDQLYKGDGRLKMSRSLERVWPGVARTTRKFQRPQHQIADNWAKFDTQLQLKPGISLEGLGVNEMGMDLTVRKEIKSDKLEGIVSEYRRKRAD